VCFWKQKRTILIDAAKKWQRKLVRIYWSVNPQDKPITLKLGNCNMTINPIIATPSVEVGNLRISKQILDKIIWLIENPEKKVSLCVSSVLVQSRKIEAL